MEQDKEISCNINSFGNLLGRSYNNLQDLNARMNEIQSYLLSKEVFFTFEPEDMMKVYKMLIKRSEFEASLFTSIMSIASKHEQIKLIVDRLFTKDDTKVITMSPELQRVADTIKKEMIDVIDNSDNVEGDNEE